MRKVYNKLENIMKILTIKNKWKLLIPSAIIAIGVSTFVYIAIMLLEYNGTILILENKSIVLFAIGIGLADGIINYNKGLKDLKNL